MQQVKNVWIEFGVSLDVASNDACESGLGNLWMKKTRGYRLDLDHGWDIFG